MAKKTKKSVKIPKSVMGVKVPKALRKASVVQSLLQNPLGRAILADALVAAAGAAAAALAKHAPGGDQLARGGHAVADATAGAVGKGSDLVSSAVNTLSEVVSDVVTPRDKRGRDKDQQNNRDDRRH